MWIFPWIQLFWHSHSMWDKLGWHNWFWQFLSTKGLSSFNPKGFYYSYAWSSSLCERISYCSGLISISYHSWNPSPAPHPLIKRGYDLPKINSLGGGGVQNFLLERGNKPVKRYGWCKNGGVATFLLLYTAVQSHLLCVWGESKVPFLPFGSSVF